MESRAKTTSVSSTARSASEEDGHHAAARLAGLGDSRTKKWSWLALTGWRRVSQASQRAGSSVCSFAFRA